MCLLGVAVACGGGETIGEGPPSTRVPTHTPVAAPTATPEPSPEPSVAPSPEIVGSWVSAGIEGGQIHEIVTDPERPEIIYAATSAGVFRSDNAGATWAPASDGIRDHRGFLPIDGVTTIEIDPNDPTVIYAGTRVGLWKSMNEAGTWSSAASGLRHENGSSLSIQDIAVDPWVPGTVYVASGGIYRTTDSAANWQQVETPFSVVAARSVAVHPEIPGLVLVGAGGIVRSIDSGETWWERNEFPFENAFFSAFRFDPQDSEVVFATGERGVMRSTNGGASWQPWSRGLPRDDVFPLATSGLTWDAILPRRLYTAIGSEIYSLRLDSGSSWELVKTPGWRVQDLLSTDHGLYAATSGAGVHRRRSERSDWEVSNKGLRATEVRSLALSSSGLYALDFAGAAHWSPDLGRTWMAVEGLKGRALAALATHPTDPSFLAAIGMDGTFLVTLDRGITWELRAPLPLLGNRASIAFDVADHDRIFVAANRVYATRDGGHSWRQVVIPSLSEFGCSFADVAISNPDPSLVYVLHPIQGVARSTDGGETFSGIGCGISGAFDTPGAIAPDPTDADVAYAATSRALLKTTDGGETWRSVATDGAVYAIVIDPTDNTRVYASTASGIFVSDDSGESWEALSAQPTGSPARSMVVDPALGDTLLAATLGGSVERLILPD